MASASTALTSIRHTTSIHPESPVCLGVVTTVLPTRIQSLLFVDNLKVIEGIREEDPEAFELLSTVPVRKSRCRLMVQEQCDASEVEQYYFDMYVQRPIIYSDENDGHHNLRFTVKQCGFEFGPENSPTVIQRYYKAFELLKSKLNDSAKYHQKIVVKEGVVAFYNSFRVCHGRGGNVDRAQRLLSRVENEGNRVGLLLSEKKTKVMTCNVAPDPILTNGGIALEEVEDFKYLGSWVNSSERDIKTRKALAWKALNSMKRVWKSNVSNELKTRLFIATVESVLLYGCESWTFTSALERSLDGCYTRMLRAALNISWQSFVPNEELYGTLPRISDKVAWRRLGLAGHCFRHKELLAGELVLWEPTHGRRGRGRPSATFIDTLKRDLGTDDKLELEVCMTNQEDWRARRAARLRPP